MLKKIVRDKSEIIIKIKKLKNEKLLIMNKKRVMLLYKQKITKVWWQTKQLRMRYPFTNLIHHFRTIFQWNRKHVLSLTLIIFHTTIFNIFLQLCIKNCLFLMCIIFQYRGLATIVLFFNTPCPCIFNFYINWNLSCFF